MFVGQFSNSRLCLRNKVKCGNNAFNPNAIWRTLLKSAILIISIYTSFFAMCSSRISCTVRATMTLWLRLKNDSISCNASDE